MNVSRRDFLKLCGSSAALVGVGAKFSETPLGTTGKAVPTGPRYEYGVLIDTTKCVGCKTCQQACKVANGLPTDERPTGLSATTLCFVDMKNISADVSKPAIKPVKRQCMHCENPACVSVCPVGAIEKKENGAVAYDADKCMGCRYCMMACPFGVPKYDWNSPNPKINKCSQACMAEGKSKTPACVSACPAKALTYGNREELLLAAKSRISQDPTKYVPQIYGEKEIGGTTMLYLSGVPFEQLGFPAGLPLEALPELTWNVQSKIPVVLGTVLTLLSGIAWWTHRRQPAKHVPVPVQVEAE